MCGCGPYDQLAPKSTDEGLWLLEEEASFEVGGGSIEAHAGDYVFGPRDIPYCYTVGGASCRMLFITTPADSHILSPPAAQVPAGERIAAITSAHGTELLD